MARILLLVIVILSVAACYRSDREPTYVVPKSERLLGVIPYDILKPRAYRNQPFRNMPMDSNDSYSMGYQAGCQTMTSAVNNGLFRVRGPKLEPTQLTGDAWYLRGYEDGATVCTGNIDWDIQ